MALGARVHRVEIELSDVDRGVYESLDLRLAQHPSESMRYMVTRTLAYCLSYEEGIAFSKGGLSSSDEAPISIKDPTGRLLAWIDIGAPSAERLHRASKAAGRVAIFTHVDLAQLQREASTRPIHKAEDIDVWRLPPALIDALAERIERSTKLGVTRTDGQLYLSVGDATLEAQLERGSLVAPAPTAGGR